ncbi:hypothetical protein OV090_18390 [Nannocystis sp. RBIL2]|nr:hypothetical protein [Nannocystis sp. RBIL2]MCY1066750.1 hypothetical protein [Nannocystis sp. RBIL2]
MVWGSQLAPSPYSPSLEQPPTQIRSSEKRRAYRGNPASRGGESDRC